MPLFDSLHKQVSQLNLASISANRKLELKNLIGYIQAKQDAQQSIRLNFICTHNSRRSHLAQVWAQSMAHYYGIKNVQCYSGGTEATALYPSVVTALKYSGFKVFVMSKENNPIYGIKYAENEASLIGFSKIWNDGFNPSSDFAAILTCSQAHEACPFVAGAELRCPITYDDPKSSDGSPHEKETYIERSLQIATELSYVFQSIKK